MTIESAPHVSMSMHGLSIVRSTLKRQNNLKSHDRHDTSFACIKNSKSIQIMKKKHVSSGTQWENFVGYSRALKAGNIIEVAGTTAVDGNEIVGINDAYVQTVFIIKKMQKALQELDADLKDVIRTSIYVTDISRWEEIGRAHGEFFKDIKPASTMVEVSALVSPEMLVEIEMTAIIVE
jgi:enamine deaminase RidA (YjgF/YER057c/UK114 family)